MRRNTGGDERIRELARAARSGDARAAVDLAHELRRRGDIASPGAGFWSDSHENVEPIVGHKTSMGPHGPDLCIVPVNDSVLHVQIGPLRYGSPDESRTDTHASGYSTVELPGLPKDRYSSKPATHYIISYAPCADMRGIPYRTASKTYEIVGHAVYVVDHERREVRCVNGRRPSLSVRHAEALPENVPELHFRLPDRTVHPRNYAQILRDTERSLVRELTPFMARWVTEHPEAFAASARTRGSGAIAKALARYEDQEEAARQARVDLANLVIERLDIMGL